MSKKNGKPRKETPVREKSMMDIELASDGDMDRAFKAHGVKPSPRETITVEEAQKIQKEHQKKVQIRTNSPFEGIFPIILLFAKMPSLFRLIQQFIDIITSPAT